MARNTCGDTVDLMYFFMICRAPYAMSTRGPVPSRLTKKYSCSPCAQPCGRDGQEAAYRRTFSFTNKGRNLDSHASTKLTSAGGILTSSWD
jgi:hypothetical protein